MGAIGVETDEREVSVDEVLRENPCDHGLADPAFFAADEMNVGHDVIWGGALNHGTRLLSRNHGLFGSNTLRQAEDCIVAEPLWRPDSGEAR